ncbi:hypothetical protein CGCVW01_v010361 [Colletotrichum viniferum]|nr:hypothetical protein CGCVW01_v010361 [Colletotrichum viniferum]
MKLVLIQLLIMAFAVIGIIVTPGGTDYNGSKNAIIAAAVKDSKADTNRLFAYCPHETANRRPRVSLVICRHIYRWPAGLETGVILTTGQAAAAASGITLGGSWSCVQDKMVLRLVAPSCEYSIFCVNITGQSGVRALRVKYPLRHTGRRFQLDAAQQLASGNNPVLESVVVAKRDPRMKLGVLRGQLGLPYKTTTEVFSLDVALESGKQDLTFFVCER